MLKRLMDIVGALTGGIVLAPLMLIGAICVACSMGRPILFRQRRPGLNGEPFEIVKFRTMSNKLGADGNPLPDAQRLTAAGRFLRATSIDELPELWNVLKGDMSLVGPRPLLMEYVLLYSAHQARRQEVRPGLTGWAQVNGRNALSWESKFDLDVWYVDNRSALLDLRIIGLTVLMVLKRTGVSAEGEATMPKFTGTRKEQPTI
ncbi:sugar transferase [Hyphomicrobium sp. D-2]|uniref:sugar transferase n=1 Tax=Hyphomicrobium sp. D-2 TaxID=3041621 RepID=UPI0024543118|nr:sugar transferase [Hyphomicrobium sp. D-2]MDH4983301.1 sugar transferase [Hyphomicrobium sp. D-2]